MLPYNKKLVSNAQTLRKNMTAEEKHLWYDFLKRLPITVKRQHNIGNYIVDFYIAQKKLVIEIDGMQHGLEAHLQADQQRDAQLNKWGITVVRYSNQDINFRFQAVAQDILNILGLKMDDLR